MSFLIRTPVPDEHERIGDITAGAFIDGGSPADGPYAAQLRDVASRVELCEILVAADEVSGEILGAVCFVMPGTPMADVARDGEAEFRMLAVDPAAQGKGVGEALARACLARAKAAGLAAVAISTAERSAAARHLYTRMGFSRVPERDRDIERGPRLIAFRIEV